MIDVDSIRRRTVLKASASTAGALAVGTPASASEEGNNDGARSKGRSSDPICGDDEAFETHTVTGGGGIDIHVDETGNENGQPILFIHGASASRLQWDKQMRSNLAGPFRLVAPDLRGHGDSDKPQDAYGESELWAADIQAVIDELDLDNPVLVGVSSGSEWISDYLRVEGEDDIAGVNMVSAAPLIEVEDPTEILDPEWLAFLQSGVLLTDDAEDSIAGIHDWIPFLTNEPVTSTDRALLVGVIATVPPRVRAAVFGRSGTTTYDDVLEDLDVPVLVSHGEEDDIILKAHAEMVAETIPNAETSFYPEAGHVLNMDNAPRFNRELRKFVAGL